jgi:HK97 family phage major capsid protein
MRAASPGQSTDPRLLQAENRATGLGEGVASDGGFLIQDNFAAAMIDKVFQTGLLAQLCRQMPISVGTNMKIPGVDETSRIAGSRWGGVRGYWADEATLKTASQPKFRQIELNLHKLIGLCYATDELMSDVRALESYIREAFADEFGFLIDDAIINGTGAGQPLGILNAGCVVSVGKETGQAASTIVYENVLKMYARLIANARTDARWLINQDCEPQLGLMSLAVGTGGAPVYLPAGGASGSPYSTLMGRPVMPIEQCQTVGTTGDIYLASFGKGYIYSQKGGIQSDMSIHVRFIYDESVFRFVLRIDGQPLMRSAITPYKGSNDLSHFVKLDART